MTLCWTLDKIGPLARSAEDCALVLGAIHGSDGLDPTAVTRPFRWPGRTELKGVRVGYLENQGAVADRKELDVLKGLGATLVPVKLPGGNRAGSPRTGMPSIRAQSSASNSVSRVPCQPLTGGSAACQSRSDQPHGASRVARGSMPTHEPSGIRAQALSRDPVAVGRRTVTSDPRRSTICTKRMIQSCSQWRPGAPRSRSRISFGEKR